VPATILVTGAAGAIGYHLCKYLADLGFTVYAVDNFIRGRKDKYYKELIARDNVISLEIDLSNRRK
jgi:nucleoside-diphosphate-sugar epimerase